MVFYKCVLVLLASVVCLAKAENLAGSSEENNNILTAVKNATDLYKTVTDNVKHTLTEFDESSHSAEHALVKAEVGKVENAYTALQKTLEAVTKLPEDPKYKDKTDKKDVEALTKELRTKLDLASTDALAWDLAYIKYTDVYHKNKDTITKDESFSLRRFEILAKFAASSAGFMFSGVLAIVAAATLLLA